MTIKKISSNLPKILSKRVEFKFYLDIEGTENEIREVINDTVARTLFEFQDYEPLIEPYQWRDKAEYDNTYFRYEDVSKYTSYNE